MKEKQRCKWCNLKNPLYIKYHDEEWCIPNFDEHYLFEMLILESFQAGLSWECVLNKRESFREAFDEFDINKICNYNEEKVKELLENKNIIRNKLKVNASINNAKIFQEIQKAFGSFYKYLSTFYDGKTIYELGKTTSKLSDNISKDLQKRGMKFVGSTIIYSYLQAIGIISSHDKECFLYKKGGKMKKERHQNKMAVFLILTRQNNGKTEILLQERYNTGYMDGKYDAACSGHVEKGESFSMALVREAKEEIDLTIDEKDLKLVQLIHSYKEDYINVFFTTNKYVGTPKIMEPTKCNSLEWFDIKNLPENIFPRVKNVLINMDNGLLYDDADFTHQTDILSNK